jgi:hypothetical protein
MIAVGEGELLAVGRPQRRIQKAGREVRQDPLGTALGRTNRDLMIACDVCSVSNGSAVGRPARMILIRVAGARKIARRTILRRYAEDVAARRE